MSPISERCNCKSISTSRRQTRKDKVREQERIVDTLEMNTLPARVVRRNAKPLEAQTEAQAHLMMAIDNKDIVFITGPAGTGKSYIPSAMAAESLNNGEIERIVIARPMQSCGEDMGFLPGDISEKYAPWVQPIMDVLEERLGKSCAEYMVKCGRIQWSPLQFMRGKSIKSSWVILDEAQNTTPEQMKMFLTRMGEGSKLIINGDLNQSDLHDRRGASVVSGLADAIDRFYDVPQVAHVHFELEDIVRHGLIREILIRYNRQF